MTLIDLSERPERGRNADGLAAGWQMPIGGIGRTRIYLSYAVIVATIMMSILVASATSHQGNADLPIAACIAGGIWMAGWCVQLFTYLACIKLRQLRLDSVTVGFFGVEARPQTWNAGETLVISAATGLSLAVLGTIIVLLGDGTLWRLPSIEMSLSGSTWHATGWLFVFQSLCQLFPLPRTLGRQVLLSVVAGRTRQSEDVTGVLLARRAVMGIAVVAALSSIAMIWLESPLFGLPRWPLLSLLAVLLGISSRGRDIGESFSGFRAATALDEAPERTPVPLVHGVQAIRRWQDRRRAKRVLEQEHREAVDAARLDEILCQLHRHGAASLSDEDRQLLQRVSESLRRHREADADNDSAGRRRSC